MAFQKTRYVARTLAHKWLVLRFGIRTKAPLWRLLIHDWTKFTPAELPAYAARIYGDTHDPTAFAQAWNHHHKRHPHHWEFWIPVTSHMLSDAPAGEPLPMPEWAVREMVADWLAATSAYSGKAPANAGEWTWYIENRDTIRLHPETAKLLDRVMAEYFATFR